MAIIGRWQANANGLSGLGGGGGVVGLMWVVVASQSQRGRGVGGRLAGGGWGCWCPS